MALVLNDRVQQTGTANTTVSFTLSGTVTGFQSFSVVGNGNTTYYSAFDTSGNWEVGIGTYSTTGPTLTRTTILSSSNTGAAVTFSGTVTVFVTQPSERALYYDGSNNIGEVVGGLTTFTGSIAVTSAVFTATLSTSTSSVLTVTTVASGTLAVGMIISGSGVLGTAGVTYITSFGTGTGGAGTYNLNTPIAGAATGFLDKLLTGTLSTLTVSAVASGTLAVGQYVSGTTTLGATSGPLINSTQIVALGTGTGNTGTYFVSGNQTVASSTMVAGGTITVTEDGAEFERTIGGNNFIRNTAIAFDSQGSILSKRMTGIAATRTAGSTTPPLFYGLGAALDRITSTSASRIGNLATSVYVNSFSASSVMTPPAFGSAYGNTICPIGVSFVAGGTNDVLSTSVNSSQRWGDTTNGAILGYVANGPRVIAANKNLSNDCVQNSVDIVAQHISLGGQNSGTNTGIGLSLPTTITTTPNGIADYNSNIIVNVAGTATLTLPNNGMASNAQPYFVATWDNGAGAAGTTLTVTSVNSSLTPFYIGCRIMVGYGGTGREAIITALGTGTGGTGTYTVSVSAYFPSCEMAVCMAPVGHIIMIKTYTANAVNSATSNIIPIAGGAAGTAILPATAGSWATLQYTGTNYEILQKG